MHWSPESQQKPRHQTDEILPGSSGFLKAGLSTSEMRTYVSLVRLGDADLRIGPFRVTESDLSSWHEPIPNVCP